jgi:hypothetical protein
MVDGCCCSTLAHPCTSGVAAESSGQGCPGQVGPSPLSLHLFAVCGKHPVSERDWPTYLGSACLFSDRLLDKTRRLKGVTFNRSYRCTCHTATEIWDHEPSAGKRRYQTKLCTFWWVSVPGWNVWPDVTNGNGSVFPFKLC